MSDVLTPEAEARAARALTQVPRVEPAPEVEIPIGLLAEITHRCPLQCPYCSNPVALERPKGELTSAEWARVFNEAASIGVVQLHISGGEPLVRTDVADIIRGARSAGLYVNLITAAVGITPEKADALAEAGVEHVQISVQDSNSEGCNRITNYKNAFEKKMEAAKLVTERGLPLTINAVVHRQNLDHIEETIALAEKLGAHRLEVAHTQYYGWAYQNRAALMPEPRQVEHATAVVKAARERLKGCMLIDYVVPDYYAKYPKPCMGGWGRQFLAVTPTGSVLPCHAAASIPGLVFDNVRERSLGWIWRDSASFNRFRGKSWMREPCRSCLRADEDFSGCRCQAMLLTGDASNTDPVCTLSPQHAITRTLADGWSREAVPDFAYRRYQ
jgi:pyrroloquinoline quinone biosynthesis protein E